MQNLNHYQETNATIMAQFIAQSMQSGISFEDAVELSFNQTNNFLMGLVNNQDFNQKVFEQVKKAHTIA